MRWHDLHARLQAPCYPCLQLHILPSSLEDPEEDEELLGRLSFLLWPFSLRSFLSFLRLSVAFLSFLLFLTFSSLPMMLADAATTSRPRYETDASSTRLNLQLIQCFKGITNIYSCDLT